MRLPVDIDAWSDAAGLTDLGGRRMSETDSPLSLVAAGVPVAGEPVAVHDAARRGSSATPNQREASEGRLLWVTGFGLSDNTALGLEERALVAFLQLTGTDKGERRRLEVLRDRAVVATEMSFTITDPRRTDDPLVWVNPAFTRLTGYSPAEVVGRNCRFLQGDATDRAAINRITRALDERVPITEVLLNYRRDGTAFWNQVSISPVFDGEGELVNFVGVQNDVTERVIVEQERRAALAEAEEARAVAAAARRGDHRDDGGARRRRRLRPAGPHRRAAPRRPVRRGRVRPAWRGHRRRVAVAARDPADEAQLHGLARRAVPGRGTASTGAVLAGGEPRLLAELPDAGRRPLPRRRRGRRRVRPLRLRSAIVVPLRARGRVLGALTLYTQHPYGRRYSARDVHLAADLAGRAGLAVDNARLYETEHAAVITLQHSLLPALPKVEGLQLAARYLVGVDGNQVGGDWYDVLPLPDGAVGVAVGDVVGHDLRAAAAMGQLRGVVRSYAWDGGGPAPRSTAATSSCRAWRWRPWPRPSTPASSRPAADGSRLVHYANAGHPAPLLLAPARELQRLDEQRSPMIGAVRDLGRRRAGPHRGRAAVRAGQPAAALHRRFHRRRGGGRRRTHRLLERTVAACRRVRPRTRSSAWSRCASPPSSATTSRCWSSGWTAPLKSSPATHGLLRTVRRSATSWARPCGVQPVHW